MPAGARISAPVYTSPGAHPSSCKMGTVSVPGLKLPGRGVRHPLPSSVEVEERVDLYLYTPFGGSWRVLMGSHYLYMCWRNISSDGWSRGSRLEIMQLLQTSL